jgi:uncharacterized integral membrane protein (TIGR00698 family)
MTLATIRSSRTGPAGKAPPRTLLSYLARQLPGIGLCAAVTGTALLVQNGEQALFGQAWLEALVLAILIGTAIRTVWTPGPFWHTGIDFSAKTLLEIAVVLLGASVSASTLLANGPLLLIGIAVTVAVAICASYAIGRWFGLSKRLALLVACGNSICGNSAIAAVAPVIGADGDEVASSIAFTAVLGVIVVLLLPFAGHALHMQELAYGALTGLTVYAVPQVLAAAAPMGAVALQMGTLVKLVRVLALGPVCFILSLLTSRLREETDELPPHVTAGDRPGRGMPAIHRLVPWFIVGFLFMIALRSFEVLPASSLPVMQHASTFLTILSMAALGLGVDIRVVARAGMRVTATATLSILLLAVIGYGLIQLMGL